MQFQLNLVNKQEWLKKYAKDRREDGVMLMIKKAIDSKHADNKGPSNSGIAVKNEVGYFSLRNNIFRFYTDQIGNF